MRALAFAVLFLAIACVPVTHTVKPLPNFVKAGLEIGDTVTVATRNGDEHEFEITEIRNDALVGKNRLFMLRNLTSIRKHSWTRPESPCGGQEPLGCSIPLLVSLASESHNHYEGKFYDACAQHDYCYRHGHTTYGTSRRNCDEEFLIDMQNLCPDPAVGKLGKLLDVMDDSLDSRSTCLSVASDYYSAVRRYGEEKFETVKSSYCEYNGPPPFPACAPNSAPPTTLR